MKKIKIIGNIIFWLTLISPIVAFSLMSIIGEADIFGVAGIVRYSWIMWCFIPIGVASIIIAIKLKQSNQRYKKNLIIAYICLPILLIFGSYRLIFVNQVFTYNNDAVAIVEQSSGIELPDQIKTASYKFDTYNVSYLKITDREEKDRFEDNIETNRMWTIHLGSQIEYLLPYDIQVKLNQFDYFAFYNITTDEYNIYPLNGQYECIFIAYDCEVQRLIVLSEYKINLT
ncbi:MAG: hypothetical protein ACI4MQ_00320 [Candidatus Coproplasma sp.]